MIKTYNLKDISIQDILARDEEKTNNVEEIVASVIENVRANGDKALAEYTEKFDKVKLDSIVVTEDEIAEAMAAVDPEFLAIMNEAAENIRKYHRCQVRQGYAITDKQGVIIGQRVTPIEKVGVYVPGGSAPLPSSVLMNVIPAKIASVPFIAMATPPQKDGKINPAILAAAKIAGVDVIYKMGGSQAIAAFAYGTETVTAVDKVVGPGNAFVAEAKRQVFGKIGIDMIAGPSEVLVIADGSCNPKVVAADMLSQAEHDRMASAVLVTDSAGLAAAVAYELEVQIPLLERAEIARASIDTYGKIILTENLHASVEIANEIAPEHLELMVEEPFAYLPEIKNAGSIFMGKNCPEPLGDYYAGTNHVLPTSGTAKFSSPLSVDDFVKKSSYIYYTADALSKEAERVNRFAREEGLTAHARSATVRFEK
ncbi:MAG: histidinol dehydrogenase [Clostridia bacterium]|nr:histidinol dehydrogenase [Clostridia bacterium]MBQ8370823.1 histidinol dehydrogenase [Clostridia bacterium]MBQ8513085.1 histidinol dehydrogenase [Clostridia bacterium]